MTHDPAMHAMLLSMWFLMAIPFVFVGIAMVWFRKVARGADASADAASQEVSP